MRSGMLFGVPTPEQYALDSHAIEEVIQMALKEAKGKEIKGKEVTPFLLERVKVLTGGKSLAASILFQYCKIINKFVNIKVVFNYCCINSKRILLILFVIKNKCWL